MVQQIFSRTSRAIELVTLFLAAPMALAFFVPVRLVIPSILLFGVVCLFVLLRDPTFNRRELWNTVVLKARLPGMILRVSLAAAVMLLALRLIAPDRLFALPLERTGLWTIIMLGYPLASAYPQELAFRTFFRHRYRPLFHGDISYLAVNATLFGLAHLVMRNPLAVIASALGGLVLAWSFERGRSTAAVWIEHAAYGCLIFTIGWGPWFYAGTIRGTDRPGGQSESATVGSDGSSGSVKARSANEASQCLPM
ncbi:MAG: CPBP family intramembrane glutamic endopeptidase [Phycisphaerales bacterium]